jgi:hypothetical protein
VPTSPSVVETEAEDMGEPPFPITKLAMLEEKVSSPRWVVPVLPEQELEVLLLASIELCKKGKSNFSYFVAELQFTRKSLQLINFVQKRVDKFIHKLF